MQNKEHSAKVQVLARQIAAIRHIVVDTETDALLLENSLIKTLQPRYNILLKDDKTYPWIVVRREPFPRVQSTRILQPRRLPIFRSLWLGKDAAQHPGIHPRGDSPAHLLAQPLARAHRKRRYSVCLQYHLGNCKGPCVGRKAKKNMTHWPT